MTPAFVFLRDLFMRTEEKAKARQARNASCAKGSAQPDPGAVSGGGKKSKRARKKIRAKSQERNLKKSYKISIGKSGFILIKEK